MTIDLTRDEAEILIAVLEFAEGAALVMNPAILEALKVIRPARSRLLQAYMQDRLRQAAPAAAAVGLEGNVPVVPPGRTTL